MFFTMPATLDNGIKEFIYPQRVIFGREAINGLAELIKPVAKRFYKIINAGLKDRLTVILTARGPQANKHIKEIINKIFITF